MPKEVVVVTTKPHRNEVEYGVRDTVTGEWVKHGVVLPVTLDDLTLAQKQAVNNARIVMLDLATADATAKGLL